MCTNPASGVIILVLIPLIGSVAWLISNASSRKIPCRITNCTSNCNEGVFPTCTLNLTVQWQACNQETKNETIHFTDSISCEDAPKKLQCFSNSNCNSKIFLKSNDNEKRYFMAVAIFSSSLFTLALAYCLFEKAFKKIFRKLNCFRSSQLSIQDDDETQPSRISELTTIQYHLANPMPSVSASGQSRRINSDNLKQLFDDITISREELKQLHADGWSCCICLEDAQSDTETNAVLHLECNHYVHNQCMRAWVDKGHTICCLCKKDIITNALQNSAT